MAEFALGLTKTAVEGTLSRVKLAIEEEGKQRERVQEDLMFITGEFQMMQAFLNASTAKERASKNLVARAWVRQLRDLAFDVEDCVEFVVHLDKPSPWDWVQRLASSLPCVATPLLPLDEAVGELKRLKARVEDVSQRNTRYNLMAGGGNNDDENQHQQQIMRPAGCHTSSAGAESFRILKDVWKAMGKLCHTTGDLKKLIDCQETGLKVISLWESPDADVVGEHGWACVVKTAYDDPEICQRFKNRAWIKLTSPFSPTDFLNNLLTHFTSHRHDRHDDMSKLMLQVSQHKYLIILEQQLSSVADWEAIKLCLPDGNNGSRIIVSTKDLGIARASAGEPFQVWELKRISRDRSFWAFFPEGCGHRIGLGEFTWQLRQRGGVTSLYWWNGNHISEFSKGVVYDEDNGGLRVFDGVKFEHQYEHIDLDGPFKLADLARGILEESYKEDTRESVYEELEEMNDQNLFERCRKLLTEHDWLIYISVPLLSPAGWDLIEHYLLCESTRGCIVVFAEDPSLAKHCVGQQQHRALDLEDLVNKSGHSHGGGNMIIKEKSESELVGREGERDFFNPVHPTILLSVWGIAGIGKSAIVRNEYSHALNTQWYRMHGWVDVPDPFNLMVLCQRLLMDLHRNDPRAMETEAIAMMEGQDPIQRCCKILHEKECYLVIDDLRSKHDWDSIKTNLLPQANPGGRTIVITRDESIAKHCTTQERSILNVTGLKDGMALFAKREYKCGGLPAIITAIGGELNSRCVHVESLHDINADFMGILERMSGLEGLLRWMKSYFDDCPDELKPCIFYMSVFPADQIIRRRRLLRRWIAEGYSSHGGTTEETGEELLCKLMELSILYQEQQTSSAIRGCKVNGFFREYIKSRQMEDNLVFALEGSCGPSSRLIGQHLTISSSWDRDESVFNSIDLSRLRSLTVFGEWKSFLICDKMKLLRVLDLESSSSTPESDGTGVVKDNDLEMIGEQFPRLKFMSLRGCIHITRLPNSLGAMKQLETLDVRHTSIVELPPAIITKLHKLQYIRAGTTEARREEEAAVAPPPPPPPTTTTQDVHCGMSPLLGAKATALCVVHRASTRITGAWKRRAHALVESVSSSSSSSWWWESKKQLDLRRRRRVAANGGGVEIPAPAGWIRTLTDLHTLGVLNVAGCGKDVFHALKKLTQLRKLGLSGVNRENWQDLCSAISVHVHLETLSLQLMLLEEEGGSYDFACFDDISWSSKTLKRLKVLYSTNAGAGAGCASIRPVWINQLRKLEGCRHDLTISYQQDIDIIHLNLVPISGIHLRIKPIEQHLSFVKDDHGPYWYRPDPEALRIDCSSTNSTVAFGNLRPMSLAELKIHCCSSCGGSSCLQVVGLQHIHDLKQVLVTGPCSDVFKEELRRQLSEHPATPELKLL